MPSIEHVSEAIFRETLTKAVHDVFQIMLGQTATLSSGAPSVITETSPEKESVHIIGPTVVGIVGFVGDISGMFHLYLEEEFANQIASIMLGMTPQELVEAGSDVVNDTVGELTNMTVGAFKSQLADRGFPCRLTIPSILRGSHFSIHPVAAASRRIYRFEIGAHQLVADLSLKTVSSTNVEELAADFTTAAQHDT